MLNQQVMTLFNQLDRPDASGEKVKELFTTYHFNGVQVETVAGERGETDFIKITVQGRKGKISGGEAPTLGIVGRLGGLGARPEVQGFVSDGDGALAALAAALKIVDMQSKGDEMDGDIIISTHVDPDAPTQPHDPVPFMGSAVGINTMNKNEVDDRMDAILSIDATKGNRIINHNGICISPTVKEGYILRVSEDLLDILQNTTGDLPVVLPITTQDITPYGNDVFHLNSILQPAVATSVPVVGVAITSSAAVPGSGSGASRLNDVEAAARFSVETAKLYGSGKIHFYDKEEAKRMYNLYGSMKKLQTLGSEGDSK